MAEGPEPLSDPRQKRRPDTATLCNELAGVSDWRKLGLYLGVPDYELDWIERSHPTEGWKRETFSLWLKHTPSASWRDVVGALRRMRENTEAERIELKFIVGPVPASPLFSPISVGERASRPDTATLCNELAGVSDWRKLGLYLGVQDYELDHIERSHPTEGWKWETFSLWLKNTPSASWRDVVGALRRMGENTEAERIELKYIVRPVETSPFVSPISVGGHASKLDTATLCNELASVSDWHMLGLYLGVQDYELAKIERTYIAEGCGRWKREIFSLWLQHTPSASWRDVVGALRRMGEKTEAERIELKYIVGSAHASSLLSPSGVGETTNAAVVAIAKCNIRMIKGKFSSLVRQARTRLQAREIDVEDVQAFLIIMYSAPNSRDGSDTVITVVESAESLNEIFRALTKYGLWDYLNYYLLQSIIVEFAHDDNELIDMMKRYQQDLTGYVLTLKIQTYLEATYNKHSIATSESGNLESILPQQKHELFKSLSIIVDVNITEASLHYVCSLWQSLSLQFELPQLSVILYGIAQMEVPTDKNRNLDLPASVIMSDKEAQAIVNRALKLGSIKQRNTVAIIVGIVGSGKTWLIHRLFRISPPARYTSTGVAEKSFRGLMHRIANMDSWKLLSQEDILEFLAPLLKAGLTKADIVSLAKTFTEVGAPQPSAEAFIEIEELQPDADDIPSPTHSHATVAQSEKSYASQAMTRLVKTVKGPNEAFVVEFLHMIDTGGQPEFIEIMPSLIHNSNFTLLVLNLAQSLDEYPPIDYHEDGTAFKRPLPSVLTNRQVIHQYARTLQAKRPTHTGTSQHSTFTVIGTHRDCVKGKLTETLAAVNKELKSIFLPAMEDELIVYRSHDEIIFPVNLLEPDDNDKIVLEQIRQKISDAHIVEEAEVPRIPVSFFMFEQNAIKYAEKKQAQDRQVMVLSFDECVHIGTELKMSSEDVRAALIYFHRHNIFLYFQDVLPNLVFLAPRVPLDFVNAIVAFSYKVKSGAFPALKAKYVRFCNEGIITEEMLHDKRLQFSDCFVPGIYEPQHAIKLFRHIYTIAEEPLIESQQPYTHSSRPEQTASTGKREYLMMSLLDDKEDIKRYLPSPSKVAPLVIHFSNGCVPNGCFGNITSCLISKYNWKVCRTEDDKPECLAHNIVTLHVPKLSKATIVNCTRHLEIYVNMSEVKEKHFNEICSHIHSTVFSAIGKVFKVMRFEDIYVKPAFHCPCKHSPKPHIAKVCNISTGSSYLVCTKTSETSQVQRGHQFWLHCGKEGSPPTNPELKDLMNLYVNDWYRLGLALKLLSDDLDIIEEDFRGDTRKQTRKMFKLWLRTQPDASYEQLIKALHKVGCERVANSLCNKYARYRAESSPRDSSTKCSSSYNSPEQPKQHSSSSRWKYSPSPTSHKRHHIPRGWRSRSPEGGKHSRSLSSPKGRTKSRLHKQRSKSPHYSRRRSKSQSPSRKRSRSCSPRPSSSSKSPRRSRYQSTRQRSHYRFLASRSRSHSHSPLRTKTRSRSQSPHKQKLKHRSARRSTPQSPSRKWSRSRSPRHNSSSRHHSRSQSPKLRRSRSHSWSPWERYCSGSPTSRNTSPSHSPKRSKSRSHSSRKQRSKSSSPRGRSVSRSPRHSSSSRHHSRSRSPKPHKSPTSRNTSHSNSSKRKTESRSHKQKSKSRRSRTQSPPRRRSSPTHRSSNRHQSRPHSPRSRRHRSQSHSWSPRRRSHSRSPTSRSTFHSHSSKRRRSKSRSLSPHKQRRKSHSTRRRSRSQSPSKKRLSSHSRRHCSSSRHRSRSQSPKSHRQDRRPSHSWSPRQRSHSRPPTSRSTFHSHSSKRRSKSRSQSPPRKRWSMRSHSPGYSSNSRHWSRSHSPRSRRRRHFESPHRRSRSRSRTPRNSSCSQRRKRRSKFRSRSPHNC